MKFQKSRQVYVIGDGPEYGIVSIEQGGQVSASNVYHPMGGRKRFIQEHEDAMFFPINQGALDDLNEQGFMYSEGAELFRKPSKK